MADTMLFNKPVHSPKPTYLADYQVPSFLIDEVNLHFNLGDDFTLVKSHMKIRHNRHSVDLSNDLILNGEELILESIHVNGEVLPASQYEALDNLLVIHNVPNKFDLEIVTKIFPQKNKALSGLYTSKDIYCTQCEAEGFRRITYFIDRPDILTRYTTTILADKKRYPFLLSNGNLVARGEENEKHWAKWEDPFKKPCYLFALVAGNFDLLEDLFISQSNREISIKIFVEKGYGEQAQYALYALKEAMRWDEKTYGREYDLDIYMLVAISDFNMGAMENKGLNIFNTKYVLARPETATDFDYIHILSVIGHEYFHNWSGNRVTCRDWFQLSLKEGLTIFRDQSFSEDFFSKSVMRIREVNTLREVQFMEDAGPLAHPVCPQSYIEINNFYTTTIYNKGAEVLRMLQTLLGEKLFRKGMDLYFARHDGQAVTIEDYIKTMEDVSGFDLTQFRLWYSQAGTPLVTADDDYNASDKIYTLSVTQTCPATPQQPEKKPFLIPLKIALLDEKGKEIPLTLADQPLENEKVLHITQPSHIFQFKNVPSRPIPSLLRNFSAPIKLTYPYADSDLLFLLKHDTDPFNRWEAGQKYALNILLRLVKDFLHDKELLIPDEMYQAYDHLLRHALEDEFLFAEMLTLPSEKYIGEQMDVIHVDAIFSVREFLRIGLAQQLQKSFNQIFMQSQTIGSYEFNMEEVGKRQLKNRCLSYLTLLPNYAELARVQFKTSLKTCMADTQAALAGINDIDAPMRDEALNLFYETWRHDTLVVDKWFAIQAATKLTCALQSVKKLMRHEAFDIKNPNKVYALIGTFGHHNAVNFHAASGEGYAFLRDTVQQIDKFNPQISARMVIPLTTWHRYDKERQTLMREQLALLLQDKKLSSDLYELVTKSLTRPAT